MTAGDIRGDSSVGGIVVCTHTTGSTGSETPDTTNGETLYLICTKLSGKYGFLQKIKDIQNDYSYAARDGKKARDITITDCIVYQWTGGVSVDTNTAAFNSILAWLDSKHDAGDAPIYVFAYNFVDSAFIKLGISTNYLKGYFTMLDWEIGAGNIYYFKSMPFKKVT